MNILHNKNVWLGITRWCLFLILLFSFIAYFTGNWETYIIFQRTVFVQVLIALALASYSILIINFKEYRPKGNILLYAFLIYLVAYIISTILSVNPENSLWGTFQRMTGLVFIFHCFFLFFLAYNTLKEKKDWQMIFYGYSSVSLILAFSGFFYKQAGRLGGLNVNPIFLAMSLFFGLGITFYLYKNAENKNIKNYFLLPSLIIQFICLVLTGSRGYVIASFFSGLIIFLGWLAKKQISKKIKLSVFGLIIFAVVLIGVNFFLPLESKNSFTSKLPASLQRITEFSFYAPTFQSRVEYWKMAWQGLAKDRLLFGYGTLNYYYVYERNFQPDIYRFGYQEAFPDQAHNLFVDTAVNIGIFGLLSFIFLLGSIFYLIIKNYKAKKISYFNSLIFISIITGYLIAGLIIFDLMYTLIPLMLIMSFLAAVYIEGKKTNALLEKNSRYLSAIFIPLSVYSLIYLNFLPYISFSKFPLADKEGTPESINAAMEEKSFIKPYFTEAIIKKYLGLPQTWIEKSIGSLLSAAKESAEKSQSLKAYYDYSYLLLIQNEINKKYQRDSAEIFNETQRIIAKMKSINPNYLLTYSFETKINYELGDNQKAIESGEYALSLYPFLPDIFWIMSKAYYNLNDTNKAVEYLNKAREAGYEITGTRYIQVIKTYLEAAKDNKALLETAKAYAQKLNQENPQVFQLLNDTVKEYYDKDKKDLAKILAKIIVEIDPAQKNTLKNY